MLFFENIFFLLFLIFTPLYFFSKGSVRLFVVLSASYIFYGWWDYRFLALIIISTLIDFFLAKKMDVTASRDKRRYLLICSLIVNLGILGFFKYFNFFIDSFITTFGVTDGDRYIFEILLPPGISFYTFQTLAYTIDVYRRKVKSENDLLTYSAYVAFFPQLIAGPIERSQKLIPQLKISHKFKLVNLYLGTRLFIIGCFKKLVIADNLAPISDAAFANPEATSQVGLLIAAYCFAIQIYCDFSGYTDMARGIARFLGINLSINFNLPYFSASLSEFWRRWHITLSYWLRDYVYIPLGGSKRGVLIQARNLLITFGLSGLWHGANWTFILWGLLHGAWVIGEVLSSRTFSWQLPKLLRICITFNVVVLFWIVFRAENLSIAKIYYSNLLGLTGSSVNSSDLTNLTTLIVFSAPLFVFSCWQYYANTLRPDIRLRSRFLHGALIAMGALFTILLGSTNATQFVYFQF